MSAEELARKKSVRAAHRAGATRMVNQLGDLLGADIVDFDELTLLQANLSTKSKTLEALDAQIVDLTPDAQLEEEIGKADEYSEKIQRSLLKICKALKATGLRVDTRDAYADTTHGPARSDGPTDEATDGATGGDSRVPADHDERRLLVNELNPLVDQMLDLEEPQWVVRSNSPR